MTTWLFLATGCLGPKVPAPAVPSVPLPAANPVERVVGVARVDLTPPPGGVLAGHGPNALRAVGVRGGIGCDVVYLAAGPEHYTWAVCDFAHVSTLLQRRVVAEVRSRASAASRCAAIGTDRFALSATHTHGAPGHHYGEASMNAAIPTSVDGFEPNDPGYDPHMVSFLASRIATGVLRACDDARGPASLRWTSGDLGVSVSRNSSLTAHCENPGASGCQPRSPRDAVSRRMDVLEVVRGEGGQRTTAAVLAFFAIHPTAVPNGNDVYHADLIGPARHGLRKAFPATGAPLEPGAVVAFVNGAEGDVSPAEPCPVGEDCPDRAESGFSYAARVGAALASGAVALVSAGGGFETDWTLARAQDDVSLFGGRAIGGNEPFYAGPCHLGERPADLLDTDPATHLCPSPEVGQGAAAGSEDGPTILRYGVFGFAEGDREAPGSPEAGDCHSPMREIRDLEGTLGLLRAISPPRCASAEVVPLTLLAIGSRRLLLFPGEATTVTGERLGAAAGGAIIAGLTNGYLQYVATREEYRIQSYEGASTLYGPGSEEFFRARAAKLAADLAAATPPVQHDWSYHPERLGVSWRLRGDLDAPRGGWTTYRDATRLSRAGQRPEHAVIPNVPRACPAFEVTLTRQGRNFWRVPDGWTVEVDGRVASRDDQEVEIRALARRPPLLLFFRSELRTEDAMVSWAPARGLSAGTRVCVVVRPPPAVSAPEHQRCGTFDGIGWLYE